MKLILAGGIWSMMVLTTGLPAWEADMQRFVHNENIALYRKLIAESLGCQSRDEDRHAMLLTLLAEEEARDIRPPNGKPLADV
jgi:hypothetical protein